MSRREKNIGRFLKPSGGVGEELCSGMRASKDRTSYPENQFTFLEATVENEGVDSFIKQMEDTLKKFPPIWVGC